MPGIKPDSLAQSEMLTKPTMLSPVYAKTYSEKITISIPTVSRLKERKRCMNNNAQGLKCPKL